ncbi:NAD-dependent epimerase/dehydratase family protein [Vibrio ouci]|uniref:NAD(P)-dependent oxidoreductase n=1 Tax=Vibrio ouci TaxID=2499078 RepID=A0A4Y8WJJ1_9VIBR|nr:NAD(P)-dependent oxidoreductase [Vibrio ouci]TFH92994.1 NAD(P)-dependent oxidoreductase [Vibrio ouci]
MSVDIEDLKLIAKKLTSDFEFYREQRVFITGGTGFFGKWLLESFIYLNEVHSLNVSVTILSRSPSKFKRDFPRLFNHKNFRFLQGDIRSVHDIKGSYDLIIHAATDVSTELNKSNPELMRSTIMDGAIKICELAEKSNCKRILYTSSGAVYGPQPETMDKMSESFVNNPDFDFEDAYSSAKRESEKYFRYNSPCDIVIARCFSFAGPYLPLNGTYAFGNFINDHVNKRDTVIKSDGSSLRSYMYSADLVIWLLRILSSGKNRDMYNVGSSSSISIKDLAEKISTTRVKVLGAKDNNKNRYIPSVEKARIELDLKENYNIEQIINKTKAFYK